MNDARRHAPVMLREVVDAIAPQAGDSIIDATFGWGGYTRGFLEAAPSIVYGIDRDPTAAARAATVAAEFPGRFTFIEGRFGDMMELMNGAGVTAVQGVAFDVGVSSMQLDDPERGFSFQKDGPLDMRMAGRQSEATDAADVVNNEDEAEIARIIWLYGEERHSRRIARAIVAARKAKPITRTLELADIVARVSGGVQPHKMHPATRTFQALRIHVNDELGQLEMGLRAAERLLAPQGRLAVVSFHSLEDRIVKNFLRERGGMAPSTSRHLPEEPRPHAPSFTLMTRSAIKPADAETDINPRARSARLRAAVRTANDAWPDTGRHAA
ncbi:16S rRNA (cytosine(1402)-N(4))-methyltransferase RsmH [Emcibacter sp. SYSU 3D8]|uniref:16S rRNA (cytosine(1402)-N(4))-methyltransferase RsmH n=1 Tax=Emcibacter sp. SYSU 3D8 TaxID=3133969 RepID=UPI0031FEEEDA